MAAKTKSAKGISTEENKPQIMALLMGVLIGYAITCIVFIGYGILLTYTSLSEANIPLVATTTCIVSVVLAGFDAAKGAANKGWFWGIAAGLLYAVIMVLIGIFINKAIIMDARTATLIILCIAGGGLGGVLGINLRR